MIVLFIFFLPLAHAYRNVYWPLASSMPHGSFRFDLDGEYFETTSKMDVDGNQVDLIDQEQFYRIQTRAKFIYSIEQRMDFIVSSGYRYNFYRTPDNQEYHSNDMDFISVGAKLYLAPQAKWRYALFGEYVNTTYNNTKYTTQDVPDVLPLGDDMNYFTAGLMLTFFNSENNTFNFMAGYRTFSEDMSHEIPMQAEVGWSFTQFGLYGGVEGVFSLGDDTFSSNPSDKYKIGRDSTHLYNSINRNIIKPYAGLIVSPARSWSLKGQIGQVMDGSSTDKGIEVKVSLSIASLGYSEDVKKILAFKEYDVEGEITQLSPKGNFAKVNVGLHDNVDIGMTMDIYERNYFSRNILLATGRVVEARSTWAIVRIIKKYNILKVKEGHVVRGY